MTIVTELQPAAARLVCAVAERDVDESHALLNSLSRQDLMGLAVVLAASVDLDRPLGANEQNVCAAKVARIAVAVADDQGLELGDIYGPARERAIARARQIVCWIAESWELRPSHIGKAIDRDHSTVLHSIEKVTSTPALLRDAMRISSVIQSQRGAAA